MTDIRKMQIGQLVDFCVDYNERQKKVDAAAERAERRGHKRRATQNDINAFLG